MIGWHLTSREKEKKKLQMMMGEKDERRRRGGEMQLRRREEMLSTRVPCKPTLLSGCRTRKDREKRRDQTSSHLVSHALLHPSATSISTLITQK